MPGGNGERVQSVDRPELTNAPPVDRSTAREANAKQWVKAQDHEIALIPSRGHEETIRAFPDQRTSAGGG